MDHTGQYPVVTVKLGYALYALQLRLTNQQYQLHKEISFTSAGDLNGMGVFHLTEKDKKTFLTFDWDVTTTQPWMNFLSPIARPFFGYSHNHVMQWFAEGLAQKLDVKLLTHEYITN